MKYDMILKVLKWVKSTF